MDSYLNDAAVAAFAVPAFVHVATADLEVYERAVTLRGRGGELRSQGGWADMQPTQNLQGTSLRPTSGNTGTTFAAKSTVRIFNSRIGSNALSGTG
jgi:hypothetical protein